MKSIIYILISSLIASKALELTKGTARVMKTLSTSLAAGIILCSSQYACAVDNKFPYSNSEVAKIVADDINIRQALVTADFSPSLYSPECKFQDEIDTYKYKEYVDGTKKLFYAPKSHVDLVGDVDVSDDKINFKFKENLAFNIPFNPTVSLSGKVEFTRDKDGYIIYSREYWDQPVSEVIKTGRFNF